VSKPVLADSQAGPRWEKIPVEGDANIVDIALYGIIALDDQGNLYWDYGIAEDERKYSILKTADGSTPKF